jgi:hypothetical protein
MVSEVLQTIQSTIQGHQHIFLQQNCTHLKCQVTYTTKLPIAAPNNFNIITVLQFSSLYTKNMHQFTCTEQQVPVTVKLAGHSKTVGPQYETCSLSPFWHLDF